MFPFEPVPQKVKSPLTSASQMKPSQLSNTKFIGSLLNKDRAGCYLKKRKPHSKGRQQLCRAWNSKATDEGKKEVRPEGDREG